MNWVQKTLKASFEQWIFPEHSILLFLSNSTIKNLVMRLIDVKYQKEAVEIAINKRLVNDLAIANLIKMLEEYELDEQSFFDTMFPDEPQQSVGPIIEAIQNGTFSFENIQDEELINAITFAFSDNTLLYAFSLVPQIRKKLEEVILSKLSIEMNVGLMHELQIPSDFVERIPTDSEHYQDISERNTLIEIAKNPWTPTNWIGPNNRAEADFMAPQEHPIVHAPEFKGAYLPFSLHNFEYRSKMKSLEQHYYAAGSDSCRNESLRKQIGEIPSPYPKNSLADFYFRKGWGDAFHFRKRTLDQNYSS